MGETLATGISSVILGCLAAFIAGQRIIHARAARWSNVAGAVLNLRELHLALASITVAGIVLFSPDFHDLFTHRFLV